MKLPKRIRVGPVVYRVHRERAAVKTDDVEPRESLYGYCNNVDLAIYVTDDAADGQIRDTVLHEILHAITSHADVIPLLGDKDDDERLVRALAPWLLMLLRDNPKLVEALLS